MPWPLEQTYHSNACGPYVPTPLLPYLVAWYKVDEGGGTICYNSSPNTPKWPHLTYTGGVWTYDKFFYGTPLNSGRAVWSSDTATDTTTVNDSWGAFVKMYPWPTVDYYESIFALSQYAPEDNLSETYHAAYLRGTGYGDNIYFNGIINADITFTTTTESRTMYDNRWIFTFVVRTNNTHLDVHIVFDDGTKQQWLKATSCGLTAPIKRITLYRFYHPVSGWNWLYGLIGDFMFYRSVDMTVGMWRTNYNLLRGRYNMPAPSGW